MGKILIIKDVDYTAVAVTQVDIVTNKIKLVTSNIIASKSVTKNTSTNEITLSNSNSYSVYVYNVSAYIGKPLEYYNVLRTGSVTSPIVGACFFDSNDEAISDSFVSHIYSSSFESKELKLIIIPNNAAYFKLSWKQSLGDQIVKVSLTDDDNS